MLSRAPWIVHPDLGMVLPAATDTAAAAADPTSALLQYGVLGILLALTLPALWLDKRKTDARADRLEAEIRELHKTHADELRELHRKNSDTVIPAMVAGQDVMRDVTQLMRDSQQMMRDLARGAPK